MGQSMNRSDSLKTRQCGQGRLSVRSLQRSGRSSVILQRQTNRSGSKISPYYLEESPRKIFTSNPFPPRNYSKYAKNQEQPLLSLKDDNKMQNERVSLKGEDSNYSPEFKQIDRSACDYQLSISKQVKEYRVAQKSHSDCHHDITISFSKTKHHLSNPFHDETIISRQNLFKILQDQEDSQIQQNCMDKIQQNLATELSKQMTLIEGKQKSRTLEISGVVSQGERRDLFRKNGNQNILDRNKIVLQGKIKLNQMGNQGIPFNDYEYDQTNNGFRGREGRCSKKVVLSKNMQQVRDKIALLGEITDSKSQLLKSVSLHNLSQSFRRVRNWQMSPRKSVEKVQISSPFKQLQRQDMKNLDNNKDSLAHNIQSSQIIKLQRKVIINSPKTPKKRDNPSKLLLFNGNSAYLTETSIKEQIQNRWNHEQNKLSHSNGTQASISEVIYKNMASKQEALLKKSSEMKEKNDKKDSIYVPAEGEEYDLIGLRSPKKIKLQKFKQPNQKTLFQQKLKKTIEKPKIPQTLSSNESGIFPLSPNKLSKIIGQYTHKQETFISNFQSHPTKNRKQLQQPKKRYRSSQKKLNLQSKLVLF